MDDNAANHVDQLPSANGGIARLAYARAKASGIALEPLLKAAHLSHGQMENRHARLKVRDQIHFLNLVSAALADDFLGFHLAQIPDLRELGLLYYVMASAETLIDALQRGVRYSAIFNEGIAPKCVETPNVAISFRYVGVNRHPDRHQIEFWLTAVVRVCRQLTGMNILPARVRMIHPRTNACAKFAEFLGDDIEFGAVADEIVFGGKTGSFPVVSADPYLNELLVGYCEEALTKRPENRASFRSNVENVVVPLLPHGKASAAEIARRLGVGQRTFARRLSSEGLTFSAVLEFLRFDLANRYLADKNLSISQIAWMLGYQEVGGFSRFQALDRKVSAGSASTVVLTGSAGVISLVLCFR